MFRISEGAIEQSNDKGLLRIAPLTSNTCLSIGFVESEQTLSESLPRSNKGTIKQHSGRGLLKVDSLILNKNSLTKVFIYVGTNLEL